MVTVYVVSYIHWSLESGTLLTTLCSLFAKAVNTFKNARPASPFPNQAVVTKSTSATSVTVANSTEVKQLQSAAVDTTER